MRKPISNTPQNAHFPKMCDFVIGMWGDEREQILAIAYALVNQLKPKTGESEPRTNEFRLAEIITDILSDAEILTTAKQCLLGGDA